MQGVSTACAVCKASVQRVLCAGRDESRIAVIESYLRAMRLFRDYADPGQDPAFSQVRGVEVGDGLMTAYIGLRNNIVTWHIVIIFFILILNIILYSECL